MRPPSHVSVWLSLGALLPVMHAAVQLRSHTPTYGRLGSYKCCDWQQPSAMVARNSAMHDEVLTSNPPVCSCKSTGQMCTVLS